MHPHAPRQPLCIPPFSNHRRTHVHAHVCACAHAHTRPHAHACSMPQERGWGAREECGARREGGGDGEERETEGETGGNREIDTST